MAKDKTLSTAASNGALKRSRPGPGRPTREQAVQREFELLDIALELFYERGFEGTTIDAITAACKMAKRTVYDRYVDKAALFNAALERGIDQWIVPVERLRAVESDDIETSLLRIGQILVANVVSEKGQRLMRITNAESARMPEVGAYMLQHGTEQTLAFLADFFHRRMGQGQADTSLAVDAAHAFLHLVVGGPASMRAWGVGLDDAEIERQTNFGVRLFLHGMFFASQNRSAV